MVTSSLNNALREAISFSVKPSHRKIFFVSCFSFVSLLDLLKEYKAFNLYRRSLSCSIVNDGEHEVGLRLVTFGQTVVIHVEDLGYYNPSLIRFYGTVEDGSPVELVQHISQISFLLVAVKKKDPSKPKRKIGFSSS